MENESIDWDNLNDEQIEEELRNCIGIVSLFITKDDTKEEAIKKIGDYIHESGCTNETLLITISPPTKLGRRMVLASLIHPLSGNCLKITVFFGPKAT